MAFDRHDRFGLSGGDRASVQMSQRAIACEFHFHFALADLPGSIDINPLLAH
jgi:hypothetical protein